MKMEIPDVVSKKKKRFTRAWGKGHQLGANMQSANTPGVSAQMQWGWFRPGQAPGTAGDHHTQTGFLARPVLGHGPPLGPVWGATGAPGGSGREQEEEVTGQNG